MMYITEENKTKIVEHANKELTKILSQDLTKDTLHCVYEIVDVLKDLGEIEEKSIQGYSQRMMPYNNSYGTSYDYNGRSYGGNSYNSYGMDRERKMNEFMSQASNERERDLIRRIMSSM